MIGWLVWPLSLATVEGGLTLGIGWSLASDSFSLSGLILALLPFALTVATFLAVGLMAGAFTVITKRGDPLTPLFLSASTLLAGAVFPVEVLSSWLQVLAKAFPAFCGFNAMRAVLIGNQALVDLGPEVLILVAFNAVMLPLGMWMLRRALRVARVTGTFAIG